MKRKRPAKAKATPRAKVLNLETATLIAITYMLKLTYSGAKEEYARLLASKDVRSKQRAKSFQIGGQFLLDRLKEAVETDGVHC